MSSEFEPFSSEKKNAEFNAWDLQGSKNSEELVEVDPNEQLINDLEVLKQEAIEKGYAEGLQQAMEEVNKKKIELIQWIEYFQKPIQLLDEQLTQEIIQTLIWLCQHCIGIELTVNPDKFHALFGEIRSELPSLKGNKVLGMNPVDADSVKSALSDKELPGLEQALFADPALARGDFYLKGEHSELDGRLQTRLKSLFAKHINQGSLDVLMQSED